MVGRCFHPLDNFQSKRLSSNQDFPHSFHYPRKKNRDKYDVLRNLRGTKWLFGSSYHLTHPKSESWMRTRSREKKSTRKKRLCTQFSSIERRALWHLDPPKLFQSDLESSLPSELLPTLLLSRSRSKAKKSTRRRCLRTNSLAIRVKTSSEQKKMRRDVDS